MYAIRSYYVLYTRRCFTSRRRKTEASPNFPSHDKKATSKIEDLLDPDAIKKEETIKESVDEEEKEKEVEKKDKTKSEDEQDYEAINIKTCEILVTNNEDQAKDRNKNKSGHAKTHAIVINLDLDDKSRFSEEVTV